MHVFDTPGPVTVNARIPSGRVVVTTTDAPRTEVEVVPRGHRAEEAIAKIEVSHVERSGRHVVTIEQRNRIEWGPIQITWGGDVEIRVSCPEGTDLDLSGASTDFKTEGAFGSVSARTASGDLELGQVARKLEAKTASGDVALESVDGDFPASISTISGDIAVRRLDTESALRTVSGDVTLGAVRAPLTLSTTSGDVGVRSLEGGDLSIQSVSGDCRIGIAQGTRIWMDASSLSGNLRSELDVGDETPREEGSGDAADVVSVHVKTVSGDVAIVRAGAPVL